MRSILIEHARRYERWAVDDLYKLIHQASMGSEHAVTDESAVRDWLAKEIAHLGPGPDEPLIDPISPDGRIVRVHLRPFVRMNLQKGSLLLAFVGTAKVFLASTERLAEYARVATRLADERQMRFGADLVREFLAEMQSAGYPAVHHSAAYERFYQPAYRVVARELLPKEFLATA